MKHYTNYPHFVANQVLKSKSLNDSFSFLDEQSRLSRVFLRGKGIVKGLDFSCSKNVVRIEPGIAVNSQGWLVQVTEAAEYRYAAAVKYSKEPFVSDELETLAADGGSRVSYICFKSEDDALELNLQPVPISSINLNSYTAALAYGVRNEVSSRCSNESCDINLRNQVVEAWPVLVRTQTNQGPSPITQDDDNLAELFSEPQPLNMTVYSSGLPCVVRIANIKHINEQIKTALITKTREFTEVATAVQNICLSQMYSQCGENFEACPSVFDGLFEDCPRLIARFHNVIVKVGALHNAGTADFVPDYSLSFMDDMLMALGELVGEYNEFIGRYPRLPYYDPQDALVYLGRNRIAKRITSRDYRYRSHFIKADDTAFLQDVEQLRKMFVRICIMSENYIGTAGADKKALKILCYRPGAKLSDRPIPFYYDSSAADFAEYWNADKFSAYRGVDDYVNEDSDARKDTYANRFDDGLYSLNAACGKKVQDVYSALNIYFGRHRLGVKVFQVPVRTVKRISSAQVEFLQKYIADSGTRKKIKALLSDDAQKALFNAICSAIETSGGSSNFSDSIGKLAEGQAPSPYVALKVRDAFSGSDVQDTLLGISEIINEKLVKGPVRTNKYDYLPFASFTSLLNAVTGNVSSVDLSDATVLGPIRRGSTVYLLHRPDGKFITYAVQD